MLCDLPFDSLISRIRHARNAISPRRSLLVAISGIDGSGKGHVTARIVSALASAGLNVAGINVNGWLNLPHIRFDKSNPAEHFYIMRSASRRCSPSLSSRSASNAPSGSKRATPRRPQCNFGSISMSSTTSMPLCSKAFTF